MSGAEKTVPILGQQYHVLSLDAMTQFHVARRLAPLWLSLGLSAGPQSAVEFDDIMPKIGPAAFVMAGMAEEDVNYVVGHCLSAVRRQQGESRVPVVAPYEGGKPAVMFADMNMGVLFRLVYEVVRANLANFTLELGVELPSTSSSAPAAPG